MRGEDAEGRGARRILVAIGGNSLVRAGEEASVQHEREHVAETCARVADLVADGWRVVLTHGNGPQVGAALRRSEIAAAEAYPLSLDVCVATTQAEIGFLLQQSLDEVLAERRPAQPVVTVLTRTLVAADDPELQRPSKPIGPFLDPEEAAERRRLGWTVVEEDAGRYRRVVPSPEPVEVLEEPVIRALVEAGVLVIALGGGGVPVVREGHALSGIEAVVDKDLSSALLAVRLDVDVLLILTDVDAVHLDHGGPEERPLGRVTASELRRHAEDGHFPEGTMGPKVEAVLRFLDAGGRKAIVTSPERMTSALEDGEGTHVVRI